MSLLKPTVEEPAVERLCELCTRGKYETRLGKHEVCWRCYEERRPMSALDAKRDRLMRENPAWFRHADESSEEFVSRTRPIRAELSARSGVRRMPR